MKTQTITRNFVEISDFEKFILTNFGEETFSEFAEQAFLDAVSLNIVGHLLETVSPSTIILKTMSLIEYPHIVKRWKDIEQRWLEYLADLNAEDEWAENLEK